MELKLQVALGRVIRRHRSRLKYSQESFAEAVGVHRTYMGAIERGEQNVALQNLERIARALSVPLSTLLLEAEEALS
jgi:transcriptional regulator with XRE-family HTH domain